ncbi:GtrA family protein [Paenibacillus rigui]|nr:GtrA family protein [Paenibacillus rigui]
MRYSAELRRTAVEAFKFHTVGLMNTGIDVFLFIALVHLGVLAYAAQLLAYSAGMLNSYFWNGRWTFRERTAGGKYVWLKFVLWNIAWLGLSSIGLFLLEQSRLLPVFWAKGAVTGATLLLNYGVSRSWIFAVRKPDERG